MRPPNRRCHENFGLPHPRLAVGGNMGMDPTITTARVVDIDALIRLAERAQRDGDRQVAEGLLDRAYLLHDGTLLRNTH